MQTVNVNFANILAKSGSNNLMRKSLKPNSSSGNVSICGNEVNIAL